MFTDSSRLSPPVSTLSLGVRRGWRCREFRDLAGDTNVVCTTTPVGVGDAQVLLKQGRIHGVRQRALLRLPIGARLGSLLGLGGAAPGWRAAGDGGWRQALTARAMRTVSIMIAKITCRDMNSLAGLDITVSLVGP